MSAIVIIQARIGSERLPGKVLLPLEGSPVLQYVVDRSRMLDEVSKVIVATSNLPADDSIAAWCLHYGVDCFRGSEEDVLERYYACASLYRPDYVIRVTADCPFLDIQFGNACLEQMRRQQVDLIRLSGEVARGLAVEVFRFELLKKLHEMTSQRRHREHVTYFVYEHPEKFSLSTIEAPPVWRHPQLRITLDTAEDYRVLQHVANHFEGRTDVATDQIIAYLLANPDVAAWNSHIEQKPVV